MGNENSLSKGIKGQNNKRAVDKFESKIISTEYNSDYNGVKTCSDNSKIICINNNSDEDEEDIEKSKLNMSTDSSTGNVSDKEIKVPTKFQLNEGGNVVFLTGSFNNWSQWFIMTRAKGNCFELVLVINVFFFFIFGQLDILISNIFIIIFF